MRRFFPVVFWLTLFVALAFISLTKYEVAERLEASATGNIETEGISRLWFSGGAGHLIRERSVNLAAAQGAAKPIFAVSSDAAKVAWITPAGVHLESLISPPRESSEALGSQRKIAISALASTGVAGE